MFNSLTGKISYKDIDRIFLLTGGVEWEIWTTNQSINLLSETKETTKIFTYLYHREDQMKLFGFSTTKERTLFLDLIKVESVGPKLALKILSGINADDFISALEKEDLPALTLIPGLGRKTAQKIILKLKGKLNSPVESETADYKDIVTALTGMGFDKKKSLNAVREIIKELEKESFKKEDFERELLRKAIQFLSSKVSKVKV